MSRRFPLLLRLLLALAVLVGVCREARASVAPICDPRGASAIAPPPVMPVKDVELQQADAPRPCEGPIELQFLEAPRPTGPDLVVTAGPMIEAPSMTRRIHPASSTPTAMLTFVSTPAPSSAGFSPAVFRPPRW